ncbi:hypothetical protein DSECCO2_599950 [anaerobic digester metagenome]
MRLAVTRGSFCRSEPAAAFRGFLNGRSSFNSCWATTCAKLSSGIYTSPRTSKNGSGSGRRFGMDLIVRRFSVTSSPTKPSPRVEPRTNTPSRYSSETESPSILGSTTYSGALSFSRTLRSKSRTSSVEKTS